MRVNRVSLFTPFILIFMEVLYMDIENNIENRIVEIDDASDRFDDVKLELSASSDVYLTYLLIAC